MAAEVAVKYPMTVAEYLEFERTSEEKHEFYDGEVFSMTGASLKHNALVANVIRELGNAFRKRPCSAYASDLRVRTPSELLTYPDVSALCGEPELSDDGLDTLLNPQLLVEVLSPSTESYDRGKKFLHYRSIPTLKDYVLISQSEVLVEHFSRQEDDSWVLRVFRAGDRLVLPGVACEIAVDEIYDKVFPEETAEG